jgi:hypothetical protein
MEPANPSEGGEPPVAPAASAAAAFTADSSTTLYSIAFFTAASSVALLSVASLPAAAASSSTAGPAPESYRSHFCRGSSSSDDISSSSRMTRVCLPLLGATALEPLVAPPRPPTGEPLWLPVGPPPAGTPLWPRPPVAPLEPSSPGMTMPRDWSPLCTGAMSTSSSVGIITNNAVLAT